ncbi:Uncharacterised protein [Vibrio cholerae]|nr:Uncharacterised protein [Vibrio cholerae]
MLFHLLSIYLANQYYFKPYAEMDYESASLVSIFPRHSLCNRAKYGINSK